MKETIKEYLWEFAHWLWTRIVAGIGLVTVIAVLVLMFTPLNRDLSWGSQAMKNITATSTAEFTLEGIDNKQELKDRIEVMIEKTRAQQKKAEAQEQLEKLQRTQTSLE